MSANERRAQDDDARTVADAQVSGNSVTHHEHHRADGRERAKLHYGPSSRSSIYNGDDTHNAAIRNRSEHSSESLEREYSHRPRDSGDNWGHQKGARGYSPNSSAARRQGIRDRHGSRGRVHISQYGGTGHTDRFNSRRRPRSPPRQRMNKPYDDPHAEAAERSHRDSARGPSPKPYAYEGGSKGAVHYRRETHGTEPDGYWGSGAAESRDRYGNYNDHRQDGYPDQSSAPYHQRSRKKRSRSRSISARQRNNRRRYDDDPREHYALHTDNRRRDRTRGTAREYRSSDQHPSAHLRSELQQRSRSRVRNGRDTYDGYSNARDESLRDRDGYSGYRMRGGARFSRGSQSPSLRRGSPLPAPPDLSPSLRIADSFDRPPPPPSTSPPPLPSQPPPPPQQQQHQQPTKQLQPPPPPKNMPPLPPLPSLPPLPHPRVPPGPNRLTHPAASAEAKAAPSSGTNMHGKPESISVENAAEGGGSSYSAALAGDAATTSTPATPATPKQKSPADGIQMYTRISMVGEGTYGKVYKARNRETGQIVALKRMRVEMDREGFPITAMREIRLLKQLKHPNITQVLDVLPDGSSAVYVVMEYMDYDLSGLVNHPQWNPEPAHKKSLMSQLLEGLAFMHAHGILHRDIKGSNLLVNQHGQVKYVDFGLARSFHHTRMQEFTNRVITLWYRPPELLLGTTVYGPEVDIWSLGCVLLEIFMKKPAFQGQNDIDQLEQIFKVLGTPSPEVWDSFKKLPWTCYMTPNTRYENSLRATLGSKMSPSAIDLISWMLSLSPAKRPSATACLSHDYFAEPPAPIPPTSFPVSGDWHEYESKAERRKRKQAGKQQQKQHP